MAAADWPARQCDHVLYSIARFSGDDAAARTMPLAAPNAKHPLAGTRNVGGVYGGLCSQFTRTGNLFYKSVPSRRGRSLFISAAVYNFCGARS